MTAALFTEPTTEYWQDVTSEVPRRFSVKPPYRFGYPVRLPDQRVLVLPLRQLPNGDTAVASLIANQASHEVVAVLSQHMANQAQTLDPEILVALPTLGLAFASLVATRLDQTRFVPFGYSRKFWYDDALSEPVASITSPGPGKLLRVDPNLLPLLEGRRVVLIDDAISTGATGIAAARLLGRIGARVAGMVVAMKQTNRWQQVVDAVPMTVRAAFGCPMFARREDGWWPVAGTQPEVP